MGSVAMKIEVQQLNGGNEAFEVAMGSPETTWDL